jgi:PmbA protein
MKSDNRLELAGWVVKEARKLGAGEVAVNVAKSRDIEVSLRDRKLDTLKESAQNSLNLDLLVDGRYSGHSTNDLRRDNLRPFIAEAVAMTRYLGEDPHRRLPDPKHYEGQARKKLKLFDGSYEKLSTEARVEMARKVEDAALAMGDNVITVSAGFQDSYYESTKVQSNGFEGERKGTTFSAGAEATVKDPAGGRPSDWDWRTVIHRKDLGDLASMGRRAVERANAKIGQSKMESGRYDMIVENRTAGRILGGFFRAMTGASLARKSSFLDGMLGEKVGSKLFHWVDDPFIPGALGSRLFDGEGMTTRKRVMVDEGVLKAYYVDNYYANKLGVEPTSGGTSNFLLGEGKRSLAEMVAHMEKGFLVSQFIGGNSNPVTGDFSFGIVGAYVEGGKIKQSVNEMNISGNLKELFHQLVELGDDPYVYSAWRRPSMRFKEIEFSGI